MRFYTFFLTILLTTFIYFEAHAQTENDLASWNAVELDYDINNDWSIGVEGQLRLKDAVQTVDEYFGQLDVKRKLFKGFKLGLALRYIKENDTRGAIQGFENHLRYHAQATYKHKLGKFRLGYRIRFQNKKELGISDTEANFSVKRLRLKSSLEYKIKDWPLDPKIWGELFSRYEKGEESEIDKIRVTLGTSYAMKNSGTIGAYWRLESSLNQNPKENLHIIGLSYNYTFKN